MFISQAFAQSVASSTGQGQATGLSGLVQYAPFIIIFVFMYFFVMRPQMKKQKEQQKLISSLAKGDEVITTGGILGSIKKVNDTYVVLEVGNAEIKCQKNAITHVLPKGTLKEID